MTRAIQVYYLLRTIVFSVFIPAWMSNSKMAIRHVRRCGPTCLSDYAGNFCISASPSVSERLYTQLIIAIIKNPMGLLHMASALLKDIIISSAVNEQ